jgi:lipid-A-disaccharide synthase
MPRLYWVVGELSAEQYAAPLAQALQKRLPALSQRGLIGPLMREGGVQPYDSWEAYSVVGFWEVVQHLPRFIRLLRGLWQDIQAYQPDRVILVDYPGLNLRLARRLSKAGIPFTYFISPQLWAWRPRRVQALQNSSAEVLCILPFEPAFYERYGVKATYIGHPLVRLMEGIQPYAHPRLYIAILPGSRLAEVKTTLPLYVEAAQHFPTYDFLIAGVSHIPQSLYDRHRGGYPVIYGQTRDLLRGATAALVTSGTATLEAALAGCPSVIGYKGAYLSYWIAKRLVQVKYIGLPNLILDKPLFPELIQRHLTPEKIAAALRQVLTARTAIQEELSRLAHLLGERDSIAVAAEHIATTLSHTHETDCRSTRPLHRLS